MDIKQTNNGSNQTIVNNESGTVIVNQGTRYTNLADEGTLVGYGKISKVEQAKFVRGFVVACLLPAISLIADLMQISPIISLPLWVYAIVFLLISFFVVTQYYDNFKIFMSPVPGEDECRYLHSDRLFSRTEDGYTIFTHTNKCIYPGCGGNISISPPPERYNGEYSFFAICSKAGRQHSYGIDYNFKAYPLDVDWRPIPKPAR